MVVAKYTVEVEVHKIWYSWFTFISIINTLKRQFTARKKVAFATNINNFSLLYFDKQLPITLFSFFNFTSHYFTGILLIIVIN